VCAAGCASTAATAPARGALDELLVFARQGDGVGRERVEQLLAQGEPIERLHAAFALGQLGVAWDPAPEGATEAATAALTARLSREHDVLVRDRILEALGKLGNPPAITALSAALEGNPTVKERERAVLALGVAAKNAHLKAPAAVDRVIALTTDADKNVRAAAVFALGKMKAGEAEEALTKALGDSEWRVRAGAARALGEIGAGETVLGPLIGDSDERVAAEAGRALARLAVKCIGKGACAAVDVLAQGPAWRPPVAAAIAAEPIVHPSAEALFAARAGSDCLLAMAHDRVIGRVERLSTCAGDERRTGVLSARALGEAAGDETPRRKPLLELLAHKDAAVRAAAAESLGHLKSHFVDEPLAQHLADEEDPAALAAILDAISAHQVSGVELTLYNRLSKLMTTDAVETLQALINAVGVLQVHEATPMVLTFVHHPIGALRSAARKALGELKVEVPDEPVPRPTVAPGIAAHKVRLETARGPVVLALYGEDAPRTVENFLKLVKRGFYDGLTFHRVVPDFVVQGGDPRGDGSGGPGWAIPCETNPHRYGEGTVGMALSGRDTGGSQFFITLSPQPHLDGRYTAFGEVVEGMAAVRALVEGDRIVSAKLVE
jgi:cyclophilin family peptidyl-prolyl cis-trans isomerase